MSAIFGIAHIKNATIETWYRVLLKRSETHSFNFGTFQDEESANRVISKAINKDAKYQKEIKSNEEKDELHGVSVARNIMSILNKVTKDDFKIVPIQVVTNDLLRSEQKGYCLGEIIHSQDLSEKPIIYES